MLVGAHVPMEGIGLGEELSRGMVYREALDDELPVSFLARSCLSGACFV